MRATVMYRAGDVRIENVPEAAILDPTDTVTRITRAHILALQPGAMEGRIHPGRVDDRTGGPDGVPDGLPGHPRARGAQGHGPAMTGRFGAAIAGGLALVAALLGAAPVAGQGDETMRIEIEVGGTVVVAALDDSAAARDFAALLPLALTLEDYHATEKISLLPRKLSTDGAPAGYDPSPGDLAYYAPWGNLAIFYRDFGYSTGLVRLGTILADLEEFSVPGSMTATLRLAE